ncbi:MAG: insulinase family protein, partial [Planctomycetes bacterium]|nr:insulinase family protein [Planctomycetota bacterium]
KAAEHVFSQQTVQSQADSLGRSFIAAGDPMFDDQYVKGIQGVTPQQVRQVMRKYFRPERENLVMIEPIGSGDALDTSDVTESAESPVIRKKLKNGLTVLIKRHAAVPIVSMQAFVKGGMLSDSNENSGRAALSSRLMARGTEKYTGDQIAQYFDSIGGSLDTNSQRNTSFLQCQVLKDDFETAFGYAHQVLFKPTFPEGEFKKAQQLQLGRIAQRQANPQAEILDFFASLLPKANPFGRTVLGTQETVSNLTVDDCRDFHKRFFVPANMVLAIYGDIDPKETLQMVEKTFGKQPAGADSLPSYPKQHSMPRDIRARLDTRRENTAMVLIGFPTCNVFDPKTRAALEIVSTVLTGGRGAGGRLFNELRGARLVYYVFGYQLTGLPPGYFLFMAQTRPETVDEVVKRIRAGVDKIRTEGIPGDEFQRAKEKLITGHAMSNTTSSSQAFQAALDELYGLGHDYDRSFDERINATTIDEVKEVLNRHFKAAYIVTSSPKSAEKTATAPER